MSRSPRLPHAIIRLTDAERNYVARLVGDMGPVNVERLLGVSKATLEALRSEHGVLTRVCITRVRAALADVRAVAV